MRLTPSIAIVLTALLVTGCFGGSHPAEGRWKGLLLNQGMTFDIGTVIIGDKHIEIPDLEKRFDQLTFTSASNETFFEVKGGNFQSTADSSGRARGSIKFQDESSAQMTLSHLKGLIKLSR